MNHGILWNLALRRSLATAAEDVGKLRTARDTSRLPASTGVVTTASPREGGCHGTCGRGGGRVCHVHTRGCIFFGPPRVQKRSLAPPWRAFLLCLIVLKPPKTDTSADRFYDPALAPHEV